MRLFTRSSKIVFRYEFGNKTFDHFFDPSAIVQQVEILDQQLFYNSRFIRTRNYVENLEANDILYPEVGTWAEDWSVSHYEDGSEILDDAELGKRRCKYFLDHIPTDNTDVTVIPINGWLMAMTG